jgi:hypothetical protein
MSKLAANMAARRAVSSLLKNMLLYDLFDQELYDYYISLKVVVNFNYNYFF